MGAFCQLQEPPSGWKLVIVDNGSTDQTPTVLASFANRLPLHAVCEPTGGKNSALNTGLGLVEGDLTVLTDDDTFPHSDWLVELRKAADAQPACSLFGGAVVPRWESPPPPWVQWLEQGPTYALTDPAMAEGLIPPYSVFGPNMAIRTAVFQSGVRFDPSIGPRGSSYPMGSETELTQRLGQQGHRAWHVPTAVVEHLIRDYQLHQSWVLNRAIRFGRGQFRLDYMRKYRPYPCWFGVPRTFFRQIFEQQGMIIKAWLTTDHQGRFSASWRRNFLWGHVVEARLSYRDRADWRTTRAEE
jgi:glycosyltransferase involved in cell wall biosynthesis